MEKLPMSPHDANMWYRNCVVPCNIKGKTYAVVVSAFVNHDLHLSGLAMMGWNDEIGDINYKEVRVAPEDYELTMPNSGYFVDAEGDLIYIELLATKTIRRSMLQDRIAVQKAHGDKARLSRRKLHYLAMDAMMTGRKDGRILSQTLALDKGNIYYRGYQIGHYAEGEQNGIEFDLQPKYDYLEEYLNHATNV